MTLAHTPLWIIKRSFWPGLALLIAGLLNIVVFHLTRAGMQIAIGSLLLVIGIFWLRSPALRIGPSFIDLVNIFGSLRYP